MDPIRRVSVVSTGTVQIRPEHVRSNGTPILWWLFTSRRWTDPMPINVCVIEHERGIVLFDTGQDRQSVVDPRYFPRGFAGLVYRRLAKFAIEPDQTLTARLATLGLAPDDVHTAVLSHLHQDHIGGLPELRSARILVSAAEWATLDAPFAQTNGLLVKHIRIPGLQWQTIDFAPTADPALAPFTEAFDLFDDGSLTLLPTPGHTPGSMSLLMRRPDRPPVLFIGDLSDDVELLEQEVMPGVGDVQRMRASVTQVKQLRENLPGLVLAPAHDPHAASGVRIAMGG